MVKHSLASVACHRALQRPPDCAGGRPACDNATLVTAEGLWACGSAAVSRALAQRRQRSVRPGLQVFSSSLEHAALLWHSGDGVFPISEPSSFPEKLCRISNTRYLVFLMYMCLFPFLSFLPRRCCSQRSITATHRFAGSCLQLRSFTDRLCCCCCALPKPHAFGCFLRVTSVCFLEGLAWGLV